MHTADYVPNQRAIYVFRGGNGREYLNDLHALDVHSMTWRRVETTGAIPQQRANHSSAILEETAELFIFGGWCVLFVRGTMTTRGCFYIVFACMGWGHLFCGNVKQHK